MKPVPVPVQLDAAHLLTLVTASDEPVRAGAAWTAVRLLFAPPPSAALFDRVMDQLIARDYVAADEALLHLTPDGRLFLDSLAEAVAAWGRAARLGYDHLTERGWSRLAARAAGLPERYRGRRGDYAVYVVLLRRDVARTARFANANPDWRQERPCFYVGMTSRPVLARLRQHLRGPKSSRYVRRFGLCLMPDLFAHLNPLDRHGAAEMEETLANDLRAQGAGVMGVYRDLVSGAA